MKFYRHKYGGLYGYLDTSPAIGPMSTGPWVNYVHLYPFDAVSACKTASEFFDGRFEELTVDEFIRIIQSMSREEYQDVVRRAKEAAQQ